MSQECEFCKTTVSSKYILKTHLLTNKKCLSIRNLLMKTNFNCRGCDLYTKDKQKLDNHLEICKPYQILIIKEEFTSIIKKKDEKIEQLEKNDYKVLYELEKTKNIVEREEYIKLNVRYDELNVRYNELTEQHEKTIAKLEMKINQCDSFIQKLALEGASKPTTTNNTVNNTIRNQLSPTYTLDKLENKQLEKTMRDNYTEHDFFGGQKRLANFFFEKVIKTPDDKMLICCTDMSRKKFKILDLRGNLKEDIEARQLCEKLKVPTQMITKEIYDKVIDRIDAERDRLSSDDRSRREKLLGDTMRAQQVYIDNMNFDDLNYNQDFMHELCVLLNV